MSEAIAKLRKALRPLKRLIPEKPGPAILMYHRIADETFDPWGMAVSPANFASQVDWLTRNRNVLPLEEFAAAHQQQKLAEDAVAITFDDGYACTFDVASEILAQASLPATVFLAPVLVDRGGEFWWDELEQIVTESEAWTLTAGGSHVDLGPKLPRDNEWRPYDPPNTSRQKAYKQLWSALHPLSATNLEVAMADLRQQAQVFLPARASHRVATWAEVQATPSYAYGSHGLHHASLPALARVEQAEEIEGGRSALVRSLGASPRAFSYPFGDCSDAVRKIVAGAGFGCACASGNAFVRHDSDLFALPRIPVGNWEAAGLERRLRGR